MSTNHKHKFSCIILAAGAGTRMRSKLPKVLHQIAGKPLIAHVLASVAPLKPVKTVVVIAPHMKELPAVCWRENPACQFAQQDKQRGTGDAVRSGILQLEGREEYVVVLYGDTPLITSETIERLVDAASLTDITVIGMRLENPTGYGRLEMDGMRLEAIVECKDASPMQKKNNLCNSGIMAIRAKIMPELLSKLTTHNAAKEYYLTDIIALANRLNYRAAVMEADAAELAGINTREQLAEAEHTLQTRLRKKAMAGGVTLIDPASVFLCADTILGQDVLIEPNVVFGQGVKVADNVVIRAFSHIEGADIASGAVIGPFARLRPGTHIHENAHVGNFVELKATTLRKGAKANHLSYVGDADVGEGANIGAGTITCNYDGESKHKTIIGDRAFIGSNTSLVAPVEIGSGAMVGAGSVITGDVAPDSLAIARAAQVVKTGKASEIRRKKKKT